MGRKIGIDLGTTNSVVAVVDGPRPKVLDNREGKPMTRSVVSLKKRRGGAETELIVGDVAMDNFELAPRDTIISIKRLMGRSSTDEEVAKVRRSYPYEVESLSAGTKDSICVRMGGKEYTPVEISALILQKLKSDAEFRLGEPVSHAVITVPAYFTEIQKDATRKAGQKAGLKVKIIDEPTAAAIAFGLDAIDTSEPKYVLVYDLGGGTFDISIMIVHSGSFAQMNLEGDMWLGGDDFDQVIVDLATAHVKQEFGIQVDTADKRYHRFLAALRKASRDSKERLSASDSADLILPSLLQDAENNLIDLELEVTRKRYEELIRPLVERSLDLVRKAIENAKLSAEMIDYVLMAGNSTCIPLVQKSMEAMFGSGKVLRNVHPKHCVALGAALMAARFSDDEPAENGAEEPAAPEIEGPELEIHTITQGNFGVQAAGDVFAVFIPKGDPYPTPPEKRIPQTFATRHANQRIVSFKVYCGENLEQASANEKQGEVFLFLPPGVPKDSRIQVKIWIDRDGIFDFHAQLDGGQELRFLRLTGGEDHKAAEAIETLEQNISEKAAKLTPDQRDQLDTIRNEAFQKMDEKDYEGAKQVAEKCEEKAAALAAAHDAGKTVSEVKKAENIASWAELVLRDFGWLLSAGEEQWLKNFIRDMRALAKENPPDIAERIVQLDKQLDDTLPGAVHLFMNVRTAINTRIRPQDPGAAANLLREVLEVEKAFRDNAQRAPEMLDALIGKVGDLIKELDARQGAAAATCSACGAQLNGARLCPQCGDDSWAPKAAGGRGGARTFTRL
ncbi:MAG: Hsp70 family protein [Planctomycetota bacterium]|nr:Hsp70 family protein [Planctomycetota bacterium]